MKKQIYTASVGIIGGSGIYKLEGLENVRKIFVDTPFGKPSSQIVTGKFGNTKVAFISRHGENHSILPSEINYKSNVYALKSLGVKTILSLSACGSLKEEIKPGTFVIPDQLFDFTKYRGNSTFYGDGIVGHTSMATPYCENLSNQIHAIARQADIPTTKGGTFVIIEGPTFSTKAESQVWKNFGFSIIGMTNLPEARLAREAEICYNTVALVTDYDVWKENDEISVEKVLEVIKNNVDNAKKLVGTFLSCFEDKQRDCVCASASKYAVLTKQESITTEIRDRLSEIL